MKWGQLLWLPSAALAWPVFDWFRINVGLFSDGQVGSVAIQKYSISNPLQLPSNVVPTETFGLVPFSAADSYFRHFLFAISCLALFSLIAGYVYQRAVSWGAIGRTPSRTTSKSSTMYGATDGVTDGVTDGGDAQFSVSNAADGITEGSMLSGFWREHHEALWLAGWLSLQPVLLAVLCWPALINPLLHGPYSSVLWLLSAAFPTVLFDCLWRRGGNARTLSLSHLPMVVLLSVAFLSESLLLGWMGVRARFASTTPQENIRSDQFVEASNLVQSPSVWGELAIVDSGMSLIAIVIGAGVLTNLLIPMVFCWGVDASPMQEEEKEEFGSLWERHGLKVPQIFFWPTGHRYSNAVVVSGLTSTRLLISDRLLANYSQKEIDWILLHELAHVRRKHHWIRLVPVLCVMPGFLLVANTFSGIHLVLWCTLLFVLLVLLIRVTCWWTEFDADRYAVSGASRWFGIDYSDAMTEYIAVLTRVYCDNGVGKNNWSHPSLKQRIEKIRSLG